MSNIMTCVNSADPFYLGWRNVTVSPLNNRAQTLGIAFGVGEPPQTLSLTPGLGDDNTFVYNAKYCSNSSDFACIASVGGVFNTTLSPKTFVQKLPNQWNGTNQTEEFVDGSYIFFNDDLHFGTDGFLPSFPMYTNAEISDLTGLLGLGPNSTFLNSIVSSGQAPTTSFGMWPGSRSENHAVNGSLWIGGYDSARVYGDLTDFVDFPMSNDELCSNCVKVTNMTYINSKGSTSLLTAVNTNLQVGLDPSWNILQVPADVFLNFLEASGGSMKDYLVALPPAGDLGNLSITLNGKYTTTIPAQELWLPEYYYGTDGSLRIFNNTYLVGGMTNSTPPPDTVYTWGMPFLTMNYMIMDYNDLTMRLAPAIQGPPGTNQGALIQPLCKGIPPVTSTASTTTSSPTSTSPSSTSPAAASQSSHTNVGAIAGGVVGGVVGLAIIAILAFFLFRKDRREKVHHQGPGSEAGNTTVIAGSQVDRTSKYDPSSPTEMSESDQRNINQWLHTQDHKYPVVEQNTSPSLAQPIEMPAYNSGYHRQ